MNTGMRTVALTAFMALVLAAPDAEACGGSGPGGTGVCDLSSGPRRSPRLGASIVATDTTILFGQGRRAESTRLVAFASLALPISRTLTFESSLGGVLGGELRTPGANNRLGPGLATAFGLSYRAVDGAGARPLVVLGVTGSTTATQTRDAARPYEAYDVRVSGLLGKTLFGVFTPYALARAFGGPALYRWDDGARVTGTDLYKYQLGAGAGLRLGPVDVFVEGAALGERALAFGLGIRP